MPENDTTVKKLPIAENFHSLQGEGTYVGTPMHFIRLAGCSVGRLPTEMLRSNGAPTDPFPILPTGKPAYACATYDGRPFWCDTDFRKYADLSVEELFNQTWENHICLTGGEPLMHQKLLKEVGFWDAARDFKKMIHIETSGTIYLEPTPAHIWLTVSPKKDFREDMIELASEVKILVSARFHVDDLPEVVKKHKNVYLCSINSITEVDKVNVERCITVLRRFPNWRCGVQMHKFLGLR